MINLRSILRRKAVKRILAGLIAAGLGDAGFTGDLAKMVADEGADIIVEQVE